MSSLNNDYTPIIVDSTELGIFGVCQDSLLEEGTSYGVIDTTLPGELEGQVVSWTATSSIMRTPRILTPLTSLVDQYLCKYWC